MRRVHAVLTLLACLLLLPASAGATGPSVVRDCTDNGRIDSPHSQGDYRNALNHLPSDVDEYTDCRQIIENAKRRDAKSGGGGGGGNPGGGPTGTAGVSPGGFTPAAGSTPSIPATPAERNALNNVPSTGGAPVPVLGEPITPGGSGLTEAAFRHDVPAPLLVLLVLLGLGALGMTVSSARSRGLRAPGPAIRLFDRVFPRRA